MIDRREFLSASALALASPRLRWLPRASSAESRPVPSRSQLEWQRDEFALFLHFGVNTFTDREWGDGSENPAIFAPSRLDAQQWARTAKAAGARAMILTAKHHDGFCLWPTKTTEHSVANSGWLGGKGDVVREFVTACRGEGLKAGLYLSPWDRNNSAYGDSPRYNALYRAQLTELLTQYGPIAEVWFDGANGEGPNGKKQVYDWPATWALVRKLQPNAVMFSDAGPDVRWIGNETGNASDTNWSTFNPKIVPVPGVSGDAVSSMLQHGDAAGTVWCPGETDVSIRPGWFYHPAENERVRTADRLVDLYFTSVGRNSKLLLNVPPTREGVLHDVDVARLTQMRRRLDIIFASDLAARGKPRWQKTGDRTATLEIDLGAPMEVGLLDLREDIQHGQVIARYALDVPDAGGWRPVVHGTTIGCRKLDRFTPVQVSKVRLRIEDAVEAPRPVDLRLYSGG